MIVPYFGCYAYYGAGYKDSRRVARSFSETVAGSGVFRNRGLTERETTGYEAVDDK